MPFGLMLRQMEDGTIINSFQKLIKHLPSLQKLQTIPELLQLLYESVDVKGKRTLLIHLYNFHSALVS